MDTDTLITPSDVAMAQSRLARSVSHIIKYSLLSIGGRNRNFEITNSFLYAFGALSDLSLANENYAREISQIIGDEFGGGISDYIYFNSLSGSERDLIESVFQYVGYSRTGASAHKAKARENIRKYARELSNPISSRGPSR